MAYWSSVPGAAWCSMDLGSAYKESGGGDELCLNEKIAMVLEMSVTYACIFVHVYTIGLLPISLKKHNK